VREPFPGRVVAAPDPAGLQLKALEEATGLQLSTGRPEAGAALLRLAHKAVSAALDFRAAANALKQSQCSTLRVGTILDPEFIRLGPFVRSLTASSQNIEMSSGMA
jgi:hypothetical protein